MFVESGAVLVQKLEHFRFELILAVNRVVSNAFFPEVQILLAFLADEIFQEADRSGFVFHVFGNQRDRPSRNARARSERRRIQLGVGRAVHRDVYRIRIFGVQRVFLRRQVAALIDHGEIAALGDFFFHLRAFVDEDVFGEQPLLVGLAQRLQPADIFRIGLAVVQLAVFFVRDGEEILQISFKAAVADIVELGQAERNQRLAFDFRELFLRHLQRVQETFGRAHVRFAQGFVHVFADEERLVGHVFPRIFFKILRRRRGVRIHVRIAVFLLVPGHLGRIGHLHEIRVVFFGQLVQRQHQVAFDHRFDAVLPPAEGDEIGQAAGGDHRVQLFVFVASSTMKLTLTPVFS